nr:MAG TPA: hypothetical protein [Caudoviricetes sp.]
MFSFQRAFVYGYKYNIFVINMIIIEHVFKHTWMGKV